MKGESPPPLPKLPYAAPPAPGPKLGLGRQSRLGSGRGPGTSSGVRRRVRPRSGIRVWQTSNISLGSGMVRRGVCPPSGRIRRGLGTRVLLTCPGPADPRYWGGSFLWIWAVMALGTLESTSRAASDTWAGSQLSAGGGSGRCALRRYARRALLTDGHTDAARRLQSTDMMAP